MDTLDNESHDAFPTACIDSTCHSNFYIKVYVQPLNKTVCLAHENKTCEWWRGNSNIEHNDDKVKNGNWHKS